MVKYSRKVRASLSQHNILYNTKRVCNYLSITNEIKTCQNENIFGYRGKKIYCETHFLKEKKLALKHGESVESFIIGKPKSQNNIPTCTKKSCYTIGFKKINKKWLCQKHHIREKL